jgi:hypothetical protein
MISITNTNSVIRVARITLWVMLLQIFTATGYAMAVEAEPNGYMTSICTTQGYQSVWIDLGSDNSEKLTVTECPNCLLNLITADDSVPTELHHTIPAVQQKTPRLFQATITKEWSQSRLPIRAPPHTI